MSIELMERALEFITGVYFGEHEGSCADREKLEADLATAIQQAEVQQPAVGERLMGQVSLPDGSAFAIASFPLPKAHWLYAPREYATGAEEPLELPTPILTHDQREAVVAAIRYAVRGATMCGREQDFDPDALVQNAVYALCGPYVRVSAENTQASVNLALSQQPATGEPFGWWFTEDPDMFCMPGSGFSPFPNKPQHTSECIALYTHPAPGVPDDVVKNAERYRWLRDSDQWPAAFASSPEPEPVRGTDLDSAIDAAMLTAAQAQKGQP